MSMFSHFAVRRSRLAALSGVAIAMTVFLTACGSSTGTSAVGKDKVLTLGISAPVTGPLAINNETALGLETFFDYMNDNGGVGGYTVKTKVVDNQSTVPGGAAAARQLLASQPFAISTVSTGAFTGAQSALKAAPQVPALSLAGGATIKAAGLPNVFGIYTDYTTESFAGIDNLKKLGSKKIAVVYDPTFAQDGADQAPDYAEKIGAEVVTKIQLPSSETNYVPAVQKIQQSGADGIQFFVAQQGTAGLLRALKQAGVSMPMMGYNGLITPSTIKLAGSAIEGFYLTGLYPLLSEDNEAVKVFKKEMAAREPKAATQLGLVGWEGGLIVQQALKSLVDSDQEVTQKSFMKALSGLGGKSVGVLSDFGWSAKYQASVDGADPSVYSLYRVKGGQFVRVD